MNESWRQAEADAHEAKADSLRVAIEALEGVTGALDGPTAGMVEGIIGVLNRDLARHEKAAKLVKTR